MTIILMKIMDIAYEYFCGKVDRKRLIECCKTAQILDEATNALDTINEKKIVDALNTAFENRTVVVIAHRLSTIRNADQIVVLDHGNIVEVGNHESLLERKGLYYELVKSQSDKIDD